MKNNYIRFIQEFAVDRNLAVKYIFISIFIILFTVCSTTAPRYQSEMVDALAGYIDREQFYILLLTFVILYAFKYIFEYLHKAMAVSVCERIATKVRNKINSKLLKLSPEYFDSHTSGDVAARISKELTVIKRNGILLFLNLISNICTIAVVIPLMISVNIFISCLSISFLVCYLIIYKKIAGKIEMKSRKNFEDNEKIISCIDENFDNWLIARFYDSQNYFLNRFEKVSRDYENSSKDLEKTYLTNSNISIFIMFISIVSIWVIGGITVLNGKLSVGDILLLSNYQNLLFGPVQYFATFANDFSTTKMALQRLYDYLDYENDFAGESDLNKKIEKIALNNVGFAYENKQILKNCNLTFEAGKIYGISGASGSGKSTLIKLITKLLSPDEGEVLINGICLDAVNTNQYRKQIGYVTVNNLFFKDSLINNLVFDMRQDKEAVAVMCDNCEISNEIKIESFIDYKHKNISEGQARRLDIVRALLKEPSVIILDEAISSIEFKKREKIFRYIRSKLSNYIVILVSHNKEDIKLIDMEYKICNGTVNENILLGN